ncbi:MAG: SCO7613 C-terminal domain-containing membrane protein [Actinomycetes bacterium]
MSVVPPLSPSADPASSGGSTAADLALAGPVAFPRSPVELRSTTVCPACLTPLREARCARCGLDLTQPSAIELARVSQQAADLLDARVALIGRIRREGAASIVAPSAAASAAPAPPAHAASAAAPPAAPRLSSAPVPPSPRSGRSGRSSIQIALIIIGISLLSVFAIFGLVYAFLTYGQTVRMLIVAAGTLATLAAAAALSRRGLSATAEGIAALGTVVLVLDAWALRENDPRGLGAQPELAYWGAALIVVGIICVVWSRLGRLHSPALGAALLVPLGAAMLATHLAEPLDAQWGSTILAGASTAVGGIVGASAALVHPALTSRETPGIARGARLIAVLTAIGLGTVAASAISLGLDDATATLVLSIALALVALAHAALLARVAGVGHSLERWLAAAAGALAVLAAVAGSAIGAARLPAGDTAVWLPLLVATAIAVVLELGVARREPSPGAVALRTALVTAAALAAALAGVAAIVGLGAAAEAALAPTSPLGTLTTSTIVDPEPVIPSALAGLLLALGFVAAGWAALGALRARARALTAVVGVLAVAAVPLFGTWIAIVVVLSVLAIGASLLLHASARIATRDDRRAVQALLAPLAVGSALLVLLVSPAVTGGWIIGTAVAVIAVAICRSLPAHPVVTAIAVAAASAIVILASVPLADDIARAGLVGGAIGGDGSSPAIAPSTLALALAGVVLLAAQLGRMHRTERRAASAVAVLLGALAALDLRAPALGAALAAAIGLGALVVVLVRSRRGAHSSTVSPDDRRLEALVAAGLIPGLATVIAAALLFDATPGSIPTDVSGLVAMLALVVVAATSLAAYARRSPDRQRRAVTDSVTGALGSILLLGSVASGAASALDGADRALLLLASAIVLLLLAIDRDGLVGSRSRRRHLGWGALALGSLALWTQLEATGETAPEPFVLPVAGIVLVVAARLAIVRRGGETTPSRAVAPLIALAALLAGAPLALASAEGPLLRALAVGVIASVVALAVAWRARELDARIPGLASTLAAAALVVLAVLAVVQSVDLAASAGAGGLPIAEQMRGVLLVIVLATVAVGAWLAPEGRERDMVSAGAAGLGALAGGVLGVGGAVDPVELVSLPIALALLAIGTLRLERDERTRSAVWLTPGLVLLLVPSLVAVDQDPALWRVVALGVVATAVAVGGAIRRLQAPLLIGTTVLLVHLLVQSWPLLEDIGRSVEWWLWLGLAGVIVVASAARYERRLQNARDLVRRIRDLR